MKTEEFLNNACPNHTNDSKWNKSELMHILQLHEDQFKPKWIPVTEMVPEDFKPVLVYAFWDQVFICDAPFDPLITHWMPLPENP